MPRYSFESEGGGEREAFKAASSREQPALDNQTEPAMARYPPSPGSRRDDHGSHQAIPATHPDSAFPQIRANTRSSRESLPPSSSRTPYMAAGAVAGIGAGAGTGAASTSTRPLSPPGDSQGQGYWRPDGNQHATQHSNIAPGADNFSKADAGGFAGNAYGVAEQNPRDSGLDTMKGPNFPHQTYQSQDLYERGNNEYEMHDSQVSLRPGPAAIAGDRTGDRASHSSLQGLNAAAVPMAQSSPGHKSGSPAFGHGPYRDDPYQGYSIHSHTNLGTVDPNEILDDGDDGLEYNNKGARSSMLSLAHSSGRSGQHGTAAAAGGVAAGAGVLGAIGGLVGKNAATRDGSGHYDPVRGGSSNTGYQGAGGSSYDFVALEAEKSAWLAKQGASSKRWKWMIAGGVFLLIAVAIALGVYFGIVKHKNVAAPPGKSAADDSADNGDLNLNSPEIQKLLNNPNLHKVFPGIDYTPIHTQYPDCVHNPPSQNNVTRDLAVLSQLTNTIRLYGTDCNQTQMLIHAVNQLELKDTVKIWLGVWQDGNTTTNERQLSQMWDILDQYGAGPFKGLIVANEILFREEMKPSELGTLLTEVRSNLTERQLSLPVATSDLGDDWTAELAQMSDYIMSNIHPFFAGVNAKDAAAWTYSFWSNQNGAFWKSDISKNIIAETGWPSEGGTDCGTDAVTDCPNGSVAGINEMNTFMENWVCQALANGTNYFWFESFDEPWKIRYNSGNQNWEDHWGLMDVNRNLKAGVKIPDCGGKTIDNLTR